MTHPLTWQQAGQSDDKLRAFLLPALIDLGVTVIIQDRAQNYLLVHNLPDAWSLDQGQPVEKGQSANLLQPPSDAGLFGADVGGRLATLKGGMRGAGDKGHVEVTVGSEQVFEFRVQALDVGGEMHFVTTITDRSEERHRERLLRALLREVSHRSKNLLAIIQSIALQTARYSGSLELFLHKFRGRLYSLSQSQDLITDSSWRGAYLFELVQQQTEKYLPENGHLIRINGDNVLLTPNASLHVGLALHELIVNAVSHGSVLRSRRAIDVTATRSQVDGRDTLEIVWDERLDGPHGEDHSEALKLHFGSTVLERVVPASVSGKAQYVISNEKISYRLNFPLEGAGE